MCIQILVSCFICSFEKYLSSFRSKSQCAGYSLAHLQSIRMQTKKKIQPHSLGIVRREQHQNALKTSEPFHIGCSTIASDHIQKPHIFQPKKKKNRMLSNCVHYSPVHLFISLELRFICVLHCRHGFDHKQERIKRRECVVNARIQESVFSNQLACGCELSKTCINISLINRLTNCLHTISV